MNIRVLNIYRPVRNLLFFLVEVSLIFLSTLLASLILMKLGIIGELAWFEILSKAALITFICVLSLYYHNLYDLSRFTDLKELLVRLFSTLGVASLIMGFLCLIFPHWVATERAFILALLFISLGIISWRLAYGKMLELGRERVLILGSGGLASEIVKEIERRADAGFQVVGVLSESNRSAPLISPKGKNLQLGTIKEVKDVVKKVGCDRIVVALREKRGRLPILDLLDLRLSGLTIHDGVEFYEHLTGKIMIEGLKPSHFVFSDGFKINGKRKVIKRLFDIVLSSMGLVLSSPISLLAAVAIWLDSDGPIIYRQERVGEGGKVFMLYKFRTMHRDAENGRPVWAQENDPRVTRVGRILRKLRIDEIPQMYNILKGDMSFVGPRPERPYFVEVLNRAIPYYAQRHVVKPGLTGWAQIKYRYGASIADAFEKLRYDLYYIKNMSFSLDMAILFETTKTILLGKGAR